MTDPRYPIGRHDIRAPTTTETLSAAVAAIASLPDELERALARRSLPSLDRAYREGGWSVRQVVHHLADSHLNAAIRTRLTLTENKPTVRPYDEQAWAELVDARCAPLEPSLALLRGLHQRWAILLASLGEESFARLLHHPEHGDLTLGQLVCLYGWHGRHHVAHIENAPH